LKQVFMARRALIIMAKQPKAGHTKTRLSPPLSPDQAAELYACLLRDTLEVVRRLAWQLPLTPFIAFYPPKADKDFQILAPDFQLLAQQGTSLSERLAGALLAVGELGYEQVAAINSDSPVLPFEYLARAFRALDDPRVDLALGPCDDGGYYLIGWKRPYPHLVREVTMSTSTVLADTVALARRGGLQVALLPSWYDIDDAAALARMRENGHAGPHVRAFLGLAGSPPDNPSR
jgi:rSAM/selenodomain-associated transferase 1